MSGPNQHYLPQMLQRGFMAKGQRGQTWLFEPNVAPRLERIGNVGTGPHFYSEPAPEGQSSLDDRITKYESERLGALLHKFKNAPADSDPLADEAAEIIGHITVRAGHFRSVLTDVVTTLGQKAVDLFSREEVVSGLFGFERNQPTERFETALKNVWDEQPGLRDSGVPFHVLKRLAFTLANENFSAIWPEQQASVRALGDVWASQFGPMVREGHNKALAANFEGGVRKAELSTFTWRLEAVSGAGVLLPDCGAIALVEDGDARPFMTADRDKLAAVVAPISSNRILIGQRNASVQVDLAGINRQLASCSHDFFIASSADPEFADLQREIGRLSREVLDEAVLGSLREYEPSAGEGRGKPPIAEHGADGPEDATSLDFGYQLSFVGFPDEATAHRIAPSVQYIVRSISKVLPLARLDGITFAADYAAALNDLDRGIEGWRKPSTLPPGEGIGLGQAPIIMRDGVLKSRIVAPAGIAHGLISEKGDHLSLCIHTLVHLLALVALADYVETALPGAHFEALERPLDRLLYPLLSPAISSYFAARFSATFAQSSTTADYRDDLAAALDKLQEIAPAQRLAYRLHGDMDRLMNPVLPLVGTVLSRAATLLGHCDGLDESAAPTDCDLERLLKECGLLRWLPNFQSDLREHWERRGRWLSIEEFLGLTKHAERILWQYAIIPWETDQGGLYVSAPLSVDAGPLRALQSMAELQQAFSEMVAPEAAPE